MKYALAIAVVLMAQAVKPASSARPQGFVPNSAQLQDERREKLLRAADAYVGKTELTGRNDGPIVDYVLAAVGLEGTRSPYCAAFVVRAADDAFGKGNHPFPRSAWSPDMLRGATWVMGKGQKPRPGDVFGIYFPNLKRIGHTGFVRRDLGNFAETVEGNTTPEAGEGTAADREGGGFWKKRRLFSRIYGRDWLR